MKKQENKENQKIKRSKDQKIKRSKDIDIKISKTNKRTFWCFILKEIFYFCLFGWFVVFTHAKNILILS
jgi:hypothetical protein